MKQINGVWLPDGDRDGWLTRAPLDEHGWPLYQRDRLAAMVTALDEAVRVSLSPRRRFVDGGAHVGLMSVPAARLFQHVDAFEPHPDTFACLKANTGWRVNITSRQVALGSSTRDVTLTARKAASSLSWYASDDQARDGDVTVSMMALDDLPCHDGGDVDAIKLDLEGGEYDALVGAQDTIKRCRPVILIEEKHDPAQRASAFLTSMGMVCTWSKKHDKLFTWPGGRRR